MRRITQEDLAESKARMKAFYAAHGYDREPDLETAKRVTDTADKASEDYEEDDEPLPAKEMERKERAAETRRA